MYHPERNLWDALVKLILGAIALAVIVALIEPLLRFVPLLIIGGLLWFGGRRYYEHRRRW